MFDQYLEESVRKAFEIALKYRHEYVTLEHLLLALLKNTSALGALQACDVDINTLSGELIVYLKEKMPTLEHPQQNKSEPSLAFQRVLQHATLNLQAGDRRLVSGANVIASFFEEPNSHATYLLSRQNVERPDLTNYANHGINASFYAPNSDRADRARDFDADADAHSDVHSNEERRTVRRQVQKNSDRKTPWLFTNLNKKAEQGDFDPLIGREDELLRTIQILCRRSKNNPLFIGEPGVGKTAIVEGLAHKIVSGEVPSSMRDMTIYSLDVCGLLAGTRYRGDFEQRLKHLINWLAGRNDVILFIDEIHTIIGAGATSGSSTDASNLLKPALSSQSLRCIGATTTREYRSIFEKDGALSRRFQKVDIRELDIEATCDVLHGLRDKFSEYHSVKYPPQTLRAAAELSARYLHDKALPDKAIDVIDEAGAAARIHHDLNADRKPTFTIKVNDIERTIALMAQVPPRHITSGDKHVLRRLERDLKKVIFEQDHVIEKVVTAIKLSRAGLRNKRKPIGSFLFSGPTGVGKTELSKRLADNLGIALLRYDMSEYMERHTVSRLIGAPPGYVGHDQGGLLCNDVLKNPHSVVLLDEIEKAHSDIFNVLLQVMDNAFLTDSSGRKIDFANTILIMTSNAGAVEIEKDGLGFVPQTSKDKGGEEIKRIFSPEFRNRLDATLVFNPLNRKVISDIVDANLIEAADRLKDAGVSIEVGKAVRQYLATHGYSATMGVRPLQRLIEECIVKPLLDELLFGKLSKGGRARFQLKDGEPVFSVSPAKNSRAKSRAKATVH